MAATDEERLVVAIEARIAEFEKRMKQAERTGTQSYTGLRRGSKTATQQMEQDMIRSTTRINQALATTSTKIGDYGKAMIGGFVSGLAAGGLAGFVTQVHDIAKGVAEIGDQARTAGLGIKEFQQWKYAAEQNRIGLDVMIDGFKELSLRADEYVATGKGSAAEAFQRLGMSPAEVKERLKNPSELMLELIDRTRRLKDTAAGIRIFDELLGGSGGEQFVRLIEQGRDGLTGTLHEAEAVSDFLSDDMVRSAEEVDRAFNRIATTVGTALKRAVVEAYNALVAFKSLWDGIEASSASGLQARLSQLETRRKQLGDQKGTTEDSILSWIGKDAETEMKAIDDQIRQINEELSSRRTVTPPVVIRLACSTRCSHEETLAPHRLAICIWHQRQIQICGLSLRPCKAGQCRACPEKDGAGASGRRRDGCHARLGVDTFRERRDCTRWSPGGLLSAWVHLAQLKP